MTCLWYTSLPLVRRSPLRGADWLLIFRMYSVNEPKWVRGVECGVEAAVRDGPLLKELMEPPPLLFPLPSLADGVCRLSPETIALACFCRPLDIWLAPLEALAMLNFLFGAVDRLPWAHSTVDPMVRHRSRRKI